MNSPILTHTTAPDVIRLHATDNVVVAARDLPSGAAVRVADETIDLTQRVPMGHKLAVAPIKTGERIIKYGQTIGFATRDVSPGEWVHTQNMHAGEFERDYAFAAATPPDPAPLAGRTFMGYRRADGRVGTRNYIAVISTVNCSASVSKLIARTFDDSLLAEYPNVDGIVALTHNTGCGMAGAGSRHYEQLARVMAGFANHPNVAATLVIGLGCEVATTQQIVERTKLVQVGVGGNANSDNQKSKIKNQKSPLSFTIQETGGTRKTIQRGIDAIKEMLPAVNAIERESIPASEIILATECGGSDAWSGITANPALGHASDLLVAAGGTSILAETTEIYGAEHLLTRRARTEAVGRKLIELIEWWKWYTSTFGVEIDYNPSPGNKAGGLTTIYEKSLGAVAKGGTTALNAVYDYAQPVTERGFVFMDSPGFDPPSVTGMVAGGANVVSFTTGRGSCFGCKPVPSIKIVTNTATYERLIDDMDFNAGVVLDGVPVEEVGAQLFDVILDVAGGRKTKSEQQGLGDEEFLPWHIGPVL